MSGSFSQESTASLSPIVKDPRKPCAKIYGMKITREDVIRVADLVYLELSESELETSSMRS